MSENRASAWVFALVSVCVLAALPACAWQKAPVQSKAQQVLAANGPARLASGATTVRLRPAPGAKPVPEGPAGNQRTFLVLRGLSTDEQPGVVYQVYLGAAPTKDKPGHLVGTLNFFNVGTRGDKGAASTPVAPASMRSFDISRLVREQNALAGEPAVTFVPSGAPDANAHPTVAGIEVTTEP